MRHILTAALAVLVLALGACNGLNAIGQSDISGKPTVYATVNKAPNPLLVGCYMRSAPSEYNRPNKYEFCLVQEGGRYAFFNYVMDGKSLATFKDWTAATVDGDSVTSGYDGSRYFAKDGEVWQMTTTGGPHRMLRMN
uniref:Lipoprotein n=1 Tax=Desulfovibrio sp. U5L TaxID=596152 RepID=I2Q690_9BACT